MTTIKDIHESPQLFVGKEVTLEGLFIHDARNAYIQNEAEEAIFVIYDDLLKLLFRTHPALGGGPYLYYQDSIIEGVIDVDEEGKTIIRDVTKLLFFYEGDRVTII